MFEDIDNCLGNLKGEQYEPDCTPKERGNIANCMAEYLERIIPYKKQSKSSIIDIENKILIEKGYLDNIKNLFDKFQINDILDFLMDKEVYSSHVFHPDLKLHTRGNEQLAFIN